MFQKIAEEAYKNELEKLSMSATGVKAAIKSGASKVKESFKSVPKLMKDLKEVGQTSKGGKVGNPYFTKAKNEAKASASKSALALGITGTGIVGFGAATRSKKGNMDKVAEEAFQDELQKISGMYAEYFGSAVGGLVPPAGLVGAIAAAATPTKTTKEMVEQQKKKGSNFIPGVGAYRLMKRLGYSHKELEKQVK